MFKAEFRPGTRRVSHMIKACMRCGEDRDIQLYSDRHNRVCDLCRRPEDDLADPASRRREARRVKVLSRERALGLPPRHGAPWGRPRTCRRCHAVKPGAEFPSPRWRLCRACEGLALRSNSTMEDG
jgi:hypothetical protein